MTIDVSALVKSVTESELYALGLEVAAAFGLPVTSWRVDDPARANIQFTAEQLATRDVIAADLAKSAFLSTSEGDWKTVVASEVYGVPRGEATYATPTVTLHNAGGGYYPRVAGDITVKASGINKTYRTTSDGALSAGATVTFTLVADEPGADSSVIANDIDELVTTLIGVEVVSSTAAVAADAQDDDSLEDQCNDTLGALSPNGPDDAYEFVCKNSTLTGTTEITRARTAGDDDTGHVTIYVAGATGGVSGTALTAAQNAVERWATPQCIRPTVLSASIATITVTATISGEDIPSNASSLISIALSALFSLPASQGGVIARSKIDQIMHEAVPAIESITLTVPAADVELTIAEVPVLGTLTITEV